MQLQTITACTKQVPGQQGLRFHTWSQTSCVHFKKGAPSSQEGQVTWWQMEGSSQLPVQQHSSSPRPGVMNSGGTYCFPGPLLPHHLPQNCSRKLISW